MSIVPLCLSRQLCWLLLRLWLVLIWFRSVFRLLIVASGGEEGVFSFGLGATVLG